MDDEPQNADIRTRMAQAIREVINRRERAPRSPRMERALKRMIWRYSWAIQAERPQAEELEDPAEGSQQNV